MRILEQQFQTSRQINIFLHILRGHFKNYSYARSGSKGVRSRWIDILVFFGIPLSVRNGCRFTLQSWRPKHFYDFDEEIYANYALREDKFSRGFILHSPKEENNLESLIVKIVKCLTFFFQRLWKTFCWRFNGM